MYASDRKHRNESHQAEPPKQLEQKLFPVRPKVNADAEVYACALASIVAAVSREQMMAELHSQYPAYGFDKNYGRGSREHIEALHKNGAVKDVHRLSFKQVKGR